MRRQHGYPSADTERRSRRPSKTKCFKSKGRRFEIHRAHQVWKAILGIPGPAGSCRLPTSARVSGEFGDSLAPSRRPGPARSSARVSPHATAGPLEGLAAWCGSERECACGVCSVRIGANVRATRDAWAMPLARSAPRSTASPKPTTPTDRRTAWRSGTRRRQASTPQPRPSCSSSVSSTSTASGLGQRHRQAVSDRGRSFQCPRRRPRPRTWVHGPRYVRRLRSRSPQLPPDSESDGADACS